DRVLVAMLALLALASFEAVGALPSTARELSATLASGRRVLGVIARGPEGRGPATPLRPPPHPGGSPGDVAAPYSRARAGRALRFRSAAGAGRTHRPRRAEWVRQDQGDEPPAPVSRPRGRADGSRRP